MLFKYGTDNIRIKIEYIHKNNDKLPNPNLLHLNFFTIAPPINILTVVILITKTTISVKL